eukprot:TRINITY_DN7167_c0_g1_i1.p1 TRINITY_DN7167_c0_g1~~TRINITY_DN7167_c0_g1_i1.p1  ORF type:complete len:339 (+),score=26.55 TRINITY_DN7167_c0_g1_i1:51-1019(+)
MEQNFKGIKLRILGRTQRETPSTIMVDIGQDLRDIHSFENASIFACKSKVPQRRSTRKKVKNEMFCLEWSVQLEDGSIITVDRIFKFSCEMGKFDGLSVFVEGLFMQSGEQYGNTVKLIVKMQHLDNNTSLGTATMLLQFPRRPNTAAQVNTVKVKLEPGTRIEQPQFNVMELDYNMLPMDRSTSPYEIFDNPINIMQDDWYNMSNIEPEYNYGPTSLNTAETGYLNPEIQHVVPPIVPENTAIVNNYNGHMCGKRKLEEVAYHPEPKKPHYVLETKYYQKLFFNTLHYMTLEEVCLSIFILNLLVLPLILLQVMVLLLLMM